MTFDEWLKKHDPENDIGPLSRIRMRDAWDAALEEAEMVAVRLETTWYEEYKRGNGPHRASPHREGMADGASVIADEIRRLVTK